MYRGTPYEGDIRSAFARIAEWLPGEIDVDPDRLDEMLALDLGSVPAGPVAGWGYVIDENERTGRRTRVRAVLCRFGTEHRIHSAELRVLVERGRTHARFAAAEDERRRTGLLKVAGGRPMC